MHLKKSNQRRGFTIVELLIVVVVIAILAAITIVAFTGINKRAQVTSMQSDLSNNSKKLELFKAENDRYPDETSDAAWITTNLTGASGTASNGAAYDYIPSVALDSYAQTISLGGVVYVNTNSNSSPVDQSAGVASEGTAPVASSISTTSFTLSWPVSPGASSYNTTCARNTTLTTAPVATATSATTVFSRTGMNAGTIYYCGYTPVYGSISGTPSAVSSSITTPTPSVPSGLNANTLASTSFKINWSNVSGAYRYNLQCTTSADTSYATPVYTHTGTSISSGTTGVTVSTGVSAATSYICRVASKGYNNASAYSSSISFTTP